MRALLLGAGVALVAGYLVRRRFLLVTVEGISMEPTFRPGDRLVVRRVRLARVRRGAVVAFASGVADPPLMVKRAVATPGDPVPDGIPVPDRVVPPGHLVVLGDNSAHSADSRAHGYIRARDVVGVVVTR